jgi:hypothetical protein
MKLSHLAVAGVMLAAVAVASSAPAQDIDQPMNDLAAKVRTWMADPVVVKAIQDQNAKSAAMTQEQIDEADKAWKAGAESGTPSPLATEILANPLSTYLKKVKDDSAGLITEIFVMDNKGLNVGQSDLTSDYWQGDEAKWKESYGKGADAIHIGEIEKDESTQTLQSQLSVSIADPASKEAIGAVTVGVDVDKLTAQ